MPATVPSSSEAILRRIESELADTPYRFESPRALTGGTANFIYHVTLANTLPDGTVEAVVKHGEEFLSSNRDFNLSTSRCLVEEQCMRAMAECPAKESAQFSIRTPKILYFNEDTHTQVLEYQPQATSLKSYVLKHYSGSGPTGEGSQALYTELGHGLGSWLRSFHAWSNSPAQDGFRDIACGNGEMQSLKQMINYQGLVQMAETFPSVLGESKAILADIAQATLEELKDESKLRVIHGDFWTGNILLRDESLQQPDRMPVFVVDWEMCQLALPPLDIGQMVAELFELVLFKGFDAGAWLIQGLVEGYGQVDDDFAFRAALHVGAHLIVFGSTVPNWGSAEQVQRVVEQGRDVVLNAWKRDRSWFEEHNVLGHLFRQSSM